MTRRIEVLHGINFDVLGRRPAAHYGGLTLEALEVQIKGYADELGLSVAFSQTNHEGDYCEALHKATGEGLILNPGAWTHYSWAIRDALDVAGKPAVEVHISDVSKREDWRSVSVFDGLVAGVVSGSGIDGYREALEILKRELGL